MPVNSASTFDCLFQIQLHILVYLSSWFTTIYGHHLYPAALASNITLLSLMISLIFIGIFLFAKSLVFMTHSTFSLAMSICSFNCPLSPSMSTMELNLSTPHQWTSFVDTTFTFTFLVPMHLHKTVRCAIQTLNDTFHLLGITRRNLPLVVRSHYLLGHPNRPIGTGFPDFPMQIWLKINGLLQVSQPHLAVACRVPTPQPCFA